MEPTRLLHLLLLSAWGGLLLAEGVVEVAAGDKASLQTVARLHYWMDLLIEAPLLVGVVLTGTLLALGAPSLTPLHWVKMAAGLVAIGANAYCIGVVVCRYREREDPLALEKHTARIRLLSPAIGLPPGAVAAYLGFAYFAG